MGDLNCGILKHSPDAHTRKLQRLSSPYQYKRVIKKKMFLKYGVIHLGISDRSAIFVTRKYRASKSQQNIRHIRSF